MQENRLLTPTYQALMILGLDTISRRMMECNNTGAWFALRTFYHELPPDCQKECKEAYEKMEKELEEITQTARNDPNRKETQVAEAQDHYLYFKNPELLEEFKNSLFSKGYLEIAPIKPRNPKPSILGE